MHSRQSTRWAGLVVLAMLAVSTAAAQDTTASPQPTSPPEQNSSQPNQAVPDKSQTEQTPPRNDQSPTKDVPSNQAPQTPPAQAPANQAPTSPPSIEEKKDPEKKEEGGNRASTAVDRTREVTIQAAQATKRVGKQALFKARDWETGWFTGAYVEKGRTRVPMTGEQRLDIYLQQTWISPSDYMKRMFAAGIDQARGTPAWPGGWGGYGMRFASREGQFISANSLAALGNAALRYEPRYDQCECKGFWPRTKHAIVRNFVTYSRSEQQLRPQWALYGGAFGGGVIASTWKPEPRNPWTDGAYAMLGQAGYGALLNFFIEFAGDINRRIGAKTPNNSNR